MRPLEENSAVADRHVDGDPEVCDWGETQGSNPAAASWVPYYSDDEPSGEDVAEPGDPAQMTLFAGVTAVAVAESSHSWVPVLPVGSTDTPEPLRSSAASCLGLSEGGGSGRGTLYDHHGEADIAGDIWWDIASNQDWDMPSASSVSEFTDSPGDMSWVTPDISPNSELPSVSPATSAFSTSSARSTSSDGAPTGASASSSSSDTSVGALRPTLSSTHRARTPPMPPSGPGPISTGVLERVVTTFIKRLEDKVSQSLREAAEKAEGTGGGGTRDKFIAAFGFEEARDAIDFLQKRVRQAGVDAAREAMKPVQRPSQISSIEDPQGPHIFVDVGRGYRKSVMAHSNPSEESTRDCDNWVNLGGKKGKLTRVMAGGVVLERRTGKIVESTSASALSSGGGSARSAVSLLRYHQYNIKREPDPKQKKKKGNPKYSPNQDQVYLFYTFPVEALPPQQRQQHKDKPLNLLPRPQIWSAAAKGAAPEVHLLAPSEQEWRGMMDMSAPAIKRQKISTTAVAVWGTLGLLTVAIALYYTRIWRLGGEADKGDGDATDHSVTCSPGMSFSQAAEQCVASTRWQRYHVTRSDGGYLAQDSNVWTADGTIYEWGGHALASGPSDPAQASATKQARDFMGSCASECSGRTATLVRLQLPLSGRTCNVTAADWTWRRDHAGGFWPRPSSRGAAGSVSTYRDHHGRAHQIAAGAVFGGDYDFCQNLDVWRNASTLAARPPAAAAKRTARTSPAPTAAFAPVFDQGPAEPWWDDVLRKADPSSTDPLGRSIFMMPDGLRVYNSAGGWTLLGGVEHWIRVDVLRLPDVLGQAAMPYARGYRDKYEHVWEGTGAKTGDQYVWPLGRFGAQVWVVPQLARLRDEIFIFSGRTRTHTVESFRRDPQTIKIKKGSEWLLNDFWILKGPFNGGDPALIASRISACDTSEAHQWSRPSRNKPHPGPRSDAATFVSSLTVKTDRADNSHYPYQKWMFGGIGKIKSNEGSDDFMTQLHCVVDAVDDGLVVPLCDLWVHQVSADGSTLGSHQDSTSVGWTLAGACDRDSVALETRALVPLFITWQSPGQPYESVGRAAGPTASAFSATWTDEWQNLWMFGGIDKLTELGNNSALLVENPSRVPSIGCSNELWRFGPVESGGAMQWTLSQTATKQSGANEMVPPPLCGAKAVSNESSVLVVGGWKRQDRVRTGKGPELSQDGACIETDAWGPRT